MKKLTKAALLAAATAFMLAGVTACFTSVNDDSNGLEQDGNGKATATVTYFSDGANASAYSAEGTSSDRTVVTAKDIVVAWGKDVSFFKECTTDIGSVNSVKGYRIRSNAYTLTKNVNDTKGDFVDADAEILVVKATLTPVKNFTVKKISGQFVNSKSGNTVLFVNGVDSGLEAAKTLDLTNYAPATAIKGAAGTDLEIVFAIKASSSGIKNVTAADFQWAQVINDIVIVVEADE